MKSVKHQVLSEWLVIRCQQGEASAYQQLVTLWHPRYLSYARNRLGHTEVARDCAQEAWLTISNRLFTLQDAAAFPKWSYRILERRCIDWLRKTRLERESVVTTDADSLVSSQADNDEALTAEIDVAQLLRQLDPRLAIVVRLSYLEELSVREIAEILAIPTGTVKSRLFYARQLIKKLMDDNGETA